MRQIPRLRTVRTAVATAAFLIAAPVGVAQAQAAPAGPGERLAPGDNGTIKIHRAATDADDRRNQPHVCRFYIAAFNFDADQSLDFEIVPGPPFNGTPALTGDFDVDGGGDGRSDTLSLPDGRYKAFVTFAGQNGRAKQKAFTVNCPGGSIPGGDANGGVDDAPGGIGGVGTGGGGTAPKAAAR